MGGTLLAVWVGTGLVYPGVAELTYIIGYDMSLLDVAGVFHLAFNFVAHPKN